MSRHTAVLVLLFVLGVALRSGNVWHPIDGVVGDPWRESDVAGVARNYYRESMNPLYPKIDWRGDGPGYVEMEFPLYPWSVAVLYKAFGYHEVFGRILSFCFSLLTLVVFLALARWMLPAVAAIGAVTFFVLSPLVVRLGTAVQPDGLMLLCYVAAAFTFLRWVREGSVRSYVSALILTALTVLAKASAAHIGLFFLVVLFRERGLRWIRDGRIWVFALMSLLPAVAWYAHARGFWLTYGNSLGLSSEYHWIGADLLASPSFYARLAGLDVLFVWMPSGIVLAVLGVLSRPRSRPVHYALFWLGSVAVFLLVAGRTASESWAIHYHVFVVLPAAILFGVGLDVFAKRWRDPKVLGGLIVAFAGIAVLGSVAALLKGDGPLAVHLRQSAFGAGGTVLLLVGLSWARSLKPARTTGRERRLALTGTACLIVAAPALFAQGLQVMQNLKPQGWFGTFQCAKQFAQLIPPQALIISVGGSCIGASGRPVSYQAPYMFFWTDRKGFSICGEQQSLDTVRSLQARDARYLIASRAAMGTAPGFSNVMRQTFPVYDSCREWNMFHLDGPNTDNFEAF